MDALRERLRVSWTTLALLLAAIAPGPPAAPAAEFTVMAYNVEMLFDVDGVSLLREYRAPAWGAPQLARKLARLSAVLRAAPDGRGPDIICFNELEADQTPRSAVRDLDAFLDRWQGQSTDALLATSPLPPELAGLPAEAWLAKRLADDGLGRYHVAVGTWRPDPTHRVVFHTNAVFSRFPITAVRTHQTDGARGILEVTVDIEGRPLHVFCNHWKSGASDADTEPIRIGNAGVLRRRLEVLLRADPRADVILAGDFNSQYNQKQRYPQLPRTALNDVLRSQGDETAVESEDGPDLYNLWFELPPEKRGSDVWQGSWGTLMHLLVTRGLYDFRGIQYVDNSFAVLAVSGVTLDPRSGEPWRWQSAGGPGVSDHLPILARFRTTSGEPANGWLPLDHPSRTPVGPAAAVPVAVPLDAATELAALPPGTDVRSADHLGRYFRVRGRVAGRDPWRITAAGAAGEFNLFVRDPELRTALFARLVPGEPIVFTGELNRYRDAWEFVVPNSEAQRLLRDGAQPAR